jgi:hypothetical protein
MSLAPKVQSDLSTLPHTQLAPPETDGS